MTAKLAQILSRRLRRVYRAMRGTGSSHEILIQCLRDSAARRVRLLDDDLTGHAEIGVGLAISALDVAAQIGGAAGVDPVRPTGDKTQRDPTGGIQPSRREA